MIKIPFHPNYQQNMDSYSKKYALPYSPYCHVVRAMNWLSTHAVVESEGPKVIRLEQTE